MVLITLLSVSPLIADGIKFIRVPEGGIQPRAHLDSNGVLHLVYFSGKPESGDLYYVKKDSGQEEFSNPIRVNQTPGSAIAVGTVRGAQFTLGRNGRPHVIWMGSGRTAVEIKGQKHKQHPMLYTRLNDAGTGFEKERNLVSRTVGIDGGGSIAADKAGNVYASWHAAEPDNERGEAGRALYVSRSSDDGRSFTSEKRAVNSETGSCACCGMSSFVDDRARLHILFRGADATASMRNMHILSSSDRGDSFSLRVLDQWILNTCPMSTSSITQHGNGIVTVTENAGNLEWYAHPSKTTNTISPRVAGNGKAKHPRITVNESGHSLLAWADGAGWGKGGYLRWKVIGPAHGKAPGKTIRDSGAAQIPLPVWSFAQPIAMPDGEFLLIY